ncbi:Hypothetical predicted protein [Octopus vulgaris]|uniref:Uncharacterized protein n=1 Tax=Octopus vulgaris TaxID=6645 RepID=A0AA36AZK0_OCTVU|nr:Hypothetical predicted protein [Octopus vulgaris]
MSESTLMVQEFSYRAKQHKAELKENTCQLTNIRKIFLCHICLQPTEIYHNELQLVLEYSLVYNLIGVWPSDWPSLCYPVCLDQSMCSLL